MVTMTQVAARAGVSQATVSFVLGGQADSLKISAQTRERVLSVARELGYQRNQLARAMITGKSRILGVLTSPDAVGNIVQILTGIVEAGSSHDYFVKMIHLSYSGVDDDTIKRCMEWRLAGVMALGLDDDSYRRLAQEFRAQNLAMSVLNYAPVCDWGVRVHSDDGQGIRQVVSHLLALGHRRIAFFGGGECSLSEWRDASFRAALLEAGLPVHDLWIRQTSWDVQEIIEADVHTFFQETGQDRPTAIVCSADTIAMIVQRVARSLGLRLPDELSVTGYSNAPLSSFSDPSLTSVDQRFPEIGRAAAQHLIRLSEEGRSEHDNGQYPDHLVPTRLVVRKSTADAPSR